MRTSVRQNSPAKSRCSKRRSSDGADSHRGISPAVELLEDRLVLSPIVFDPDGPGGNFAPTPNVNTFDWLPGNALSVGAVTAAKAFTASGGTVQTPFNTYIQAR